MGGIKLEDLARTACPKCARTYPTLPNKALRGRPSGVCPGCRARQNRAKYFKRLCEHFGPEIERLVRIEFEMSEDNVIQVANTQLSQRKKVESPVTVTGMPRGWQVERMALGLIRNDDPVLAAALVGLSVSDEEAASLADEAREKHNDLMTGDPTPLALIIYQTAALAILQIRDRVRTGAVSDSVLNSFAGTIQKYKALVDQGGQQSFAPIRLEVHGPEPMTIAATIESQD